MMPEGTQLWTRQFGSSGYDAISSIATDGLGSVYVLGKDPLLPFLAKYDAAGMRLWVRHEGIGIPTAADVTADGLGNLYVSGGSTLAKYDALGMLLWSRSDVPGAQDASTDSLGNVYVADGHSVTRLSSRKVISGVPEYRWNYGCAPTSGGMVVGYWDRKPEYSDLVAEGVMPDVDAAGRDGDGDADHDSAPADRVDIYDNPYRQGTRGTGEYDAQTNPTGYNLVDRVIASEEHVRDYWMGKQASVGGPYVDSGGSGDPYLSGPVGQEHSPNCIADAMGTSRNVRFQIDGSTGPDAPVFNKASALSYWAAARGFKSKYASFTFAGVWNPELAFDFIKRHVDQGRPLLVDWPGHTTVCYGYSDGPGNDDWLAIRDTWTSGVCSNGTQVGSYYVEAKMEDDIEWWRFRTAEDGLNHLYIESACVWYPAVESTSVGTVFGDSFSRTGDSGVATKAGYALSSTADRGAAVIVESPVGDDNDVLKLCLRDADAAKPWDDLEELQSFVAIEADVSVGELMLVRFDYLFETAGMLRVTLGDFFWGEMDSPITGAGSMGSQRFGTFQALISPIQMGLDESEMYPLRIELSGASDPICYLDNLSVTVVPEPGTFPTLAFVCLCLFGCRARRPRRNPLLESSE